MPANQKDEIIKIQEFQLYMLKLKVFIPSFNSFKPNVFLKI